MTIRPVDLQTLIPRSSEVSRVQHSRESQPGMQQQVAQAQIRLQAEQNQRQVVQSKETAHEAGVNPDGRGGASGEQRRRRRSAAKAEAAEVVEEPGKGTRLDIKV